MEDIIRARPVSKLRNYQEADVSVIFEKLLSKRPGHRLLYQLPTGAGKTVIFSEIARRFIEKYGTKVAILTHRIELCRQTAATMRGIGIKTTMINSATRELSKINEADCYVAMAESLRNRIKAGKISVDRIGLVIIDEAHHNAFRKLLKRFSSAFVVGVTATPFSADVSRPMHKTYHELITGEPIEKLIEKGYLAKPETIVHDIETASLKVGVYGDFTIQSSDELYSSPAMLDVLLQSYETNAKGKKTLIFNNGILTSRKVYEHFLAAGYPIRHLDNQTPAGERLETLKWFRNTRDAILTSVSILTTGFDEPSVQAVILNRATTSMTLYYQMVGRGSRRFRSKKTFTIIDLGNNVARFGEWQAPVDWQAVFTNPDAYHYKGSSAEQSGHAPAGGLRKLFPNSLELGFDIVDAWKDAESQGKKPSSIIRESIRQHARMCLENSESTSEALKLVDALDTEISWRLKQYTKCHGNTTKSYRDWLADDYRNRLCTMIRKVNALKSA